MNAESQTLQNDLYAYCIAGQDDYVPTMRWKAGETRAIRKLIADNQASNIVPLFVVDNVKERQQNETSRVPSKPDAYIEYVVDEMQKTVGTGRIAFVDTHLFDSKQSEDGLVIFFGTMLAKTTRLIPVMRINDEASRRLQLKDVVKYRGIGLRLAERHIGSSSEISALLEDLGIDETLTDLIVDLEYLDDVRADIKPFVATIQPLLERRKQWRSFILLSGAYPAKVSAAHVYHKRFDWLSYVALRAEFAKTGKRIPTFGDYGIINPRVKPTSGSGAGGGAWPIIRYCTREGWDIIRSVDAAKAGNVSPYFELARSCATSATFMGRNFSFGDRYIDARATGATSAGGQAVVYITMDWIHHLCYAAAQANGTLPAPEPLKAGDVGPPAAPAGGDDDEFWDLL